MNQGDIVLMNFPYTDLSKTKLRPALVLSNKKYNTKKNLLLSAISTKKGDKNFAIALKNKDIEEGELLKESYIRLHNIFTLEKRLIIKKIGKVKKEKCEIIMQKIISFIL